MSRRCRRIRAMKILVRSVVTGSALGRGKAGGRPGADRPAAGRVAGRRLDRPELGPTPPRPDPPAPAEPHPTSPRTAHQRGQAPPGRLSASFRETGATPPLSRRRKPVARRDQDTQTPRPPSAVDRSAGTGPPSRPRPHRARSRSHGRVSVPLCDNLKGFGSLGGFGNISVMRVGESVNRQNRRTVGWRGE